MTKEQAIKFANCLKNNYTIDIYDVADFCDMVINALEIVEEFEKAQIITFGRLNGRTYAYKCGLEDGKRKALEQQENKGKVALIKPSQNTTTLRQLMQPTSEDCVSRKAMLNAITEIDNNVNMDIYTNEVRELVKELPPVTPTIPKDATNGDIIKAMFPNIEANVIKTDTGGYIEVKYLDTTDECDATAFRKNWWNAPYKRGSENG